MLCLPVLAHALSVEEPLVHGVALEQKGAVSYLHDPGGKAQLADIIQQDRAGKFSPMPANWVAGYTSDAIWVKFTLSFPAHGNTPYWLEISPAILDDIQLFVPSGHEQYQLQRLGDHQPAQSRPILHRNFIFPIHPVMDDQPQTFYARIKSTSVINFHATLWQPAAFISEHSRPDTLIGAYYGIRLFLALIALILWIWLRHGIFCLYAFYQCVVCSVQAFFAGTAQIAWPMDPLQADAIQKSLNFLFSGTVLLFYASLFDLKTHYPRVLRAIYVLAAINGVLFLAVISRAINYPPLGVNVIYLLGMGILLYISLRLLRDRRYGNLLYIASLWVNCMPILPAILTNLGVPWAPSITIMDNLILWPLISLVLVTLGLINFARNEAEKKLRDKDQALRHAQQSERMLDQRVRERTQQLEQSNERLQQEVEERVTLHQQLQGALIRKRELMAAQRSFFAMASHEFRTPLAIIDATAQRLALAQENESQRLALAQENESQRLAEENAAQPEENKHTQEDIHGTVNAMTKIRRATLRMSRMIDNFLNMDKLELVNVIDSSSTELVDLRQLLQTNSDHYRNLSSRKLELSLPDAPVIMLCDPYMISLVISNLIDNAIKYSPEDARVTIRLSNQDGMAEISIEDAGNGIPPEQLEKIFDKYSRLGESKNIHGTGLGLHVSRKIAESHEGSLTVSSTLGLGSVFKLSLPTEA